MENLNKAGHLAKWLIEKKGTAFKSAYIIASRKFHVEDWHDVQKYYNQELKTKQKNLFEDL